MTQPQLAVPPGSPVARVPRGRLGSVAGKIIHGVLGFWVVAIVVMVAAAASGHAVAGSAFLMLAFATHFAGVFAGVFVQRDARTLVLQAESLRGAGDARGAAEMAARALRLGPRPPYLHQAVLLLVLDAEARGAWDEVLAAIRATAHVPPRGPLRVHLVLHEAFALGQRGELDAAERCLARVGPADLAQVSGAWLAWTRTRALLFSREGRDRELMELEAWARPWVAAASPRDATFLAQLARAAMERTEGLFRVAEAAQDPLASEDEAWLQSALGVELHR